MRSLLIVSIVLIFSTNCYAADSFANRTISSGKIIGRAAVNSDGYFYVGLPYATPPLKALRYRQPKEPLKWNSTRDATLFKPSCFQNYLRVNESATIEDCLYINIYSPRSCLRKGNCSVGIFVPDYDRPPDDLLGHIHDEIVTVSVSYRVGSFGFLNLNPNNGTSYDKNVALLDLLEALRWIRKEISVFGGSPQLPTLIAYGDAAIFVDLLTLSPLSKGLFERIVLVSGAASFRALSPYSGCNASRQLSVRSKCAESYTKFDGAKDANIVLECLRSRDARFLLPIERDLAQQSLLFFAHPALSQALFPSPLRNLTQQRRKINALLVNSEVERLRDETLFSDGRVVTSRLRPICVRFTLNNTDYMKQCTLLYSSANVVDVFNDYRLFSSTIENAQSVSDSNGTAFIAEFANSVHLQSVFEKNQTVLRELISSFIVDGTPKIDGKELGKFHASSLSYNFIDNGRCSLRTDFHKTQIVFWNDVKAKFPEDKLISCNGTDESPFAIDHLAFSEILIRKRDDRRKGTVGERLLFGLAVTVGVVAFIAIAITCLRICLSSTIFRSYHRLH